MAIKNTVDYRLRQNIQLANGQTRIENIGQGLGNDAIDRLIVLRDKYRSEGFDVDLVKITSSVKTEIIKA